MERNRHLGDVENHSRKDTVNKVPVKLCRPPVVLNCIMVFTETPSYGFNEANKGDEVEDLE